MTVYILFFVFHVIIYGPRVCNKHLNKQTNKHLLVEGKFINLIHTSLSLLKSFGQLFVHVCSRLRLAFLSKQRLASPSFAACSSSGRTLTTLLATY